MQQVIVEFTLLLKFMNFNVASALGVGVDTIWEVLPAPRAQTREGASTGPVTQASVPPVHTLTAMIFARSLFDEAAAISL